MPGSSSANHWYIERRLDGINPARQRLMLSLVIVALTTLAFHLRFIQDDAFITYRYADNLVRGIGLVWNEGERVEGYTSFLWAVLMAIPIAFGSDPVLFSQALGTVAFAGSLFFTFKLANLIWHSFSRSLLAVLLLGSNFSFCVYATGGLETQLQACLAVAMSYATLVTLKQEQWHARRLIALSLIFAVALLTRLDSGIFVAVNGLLLLWNLRQRQLLLGAKLINLAVLVSPALLIVGTWWLWKWQYYGDLLPNTYYAKAAPVNWLENGILYCYQFLHSYWLIPFVFLFLLAPGKRRLLADPGLGPLLAVMLLWCGYLIKIGGDFMEFRLIVPILPFVFVVIVGMIFDLVAPAYLRAMLLMLVPVGSLHHAVTFEFFHGIESTKFLHGHVTAPDENWQQVGKRLGQLFHRKDSRVTIAVTAAGVVPYYSRLYSIDMLGMNDKWVARHGRFHGTRTGHQKIATLPYLLKRQVNLVIGHPWIKPSLHRWQRQDLDEFLTEFRLEEAILPESAVFVDIPLDQTYKMIVLYLVPDSLVDRLIRERKWQTLPVPSARPQN